MFIILSKLKQLFICLYIIAKTTTKTHSLSINLLLKIEITDFSIVGQFFRFFSMYNFAQNDTFVLPVNGNGYHKMTFCGLFFDNILHTVIKQNICIISSLIL